MNYLLDTHILLWALSDEDNAGNRLPDSIAAILENPDNTIFFSIVNIFEIELKKDLYIPLKFIWAAKPDGCVGRYSVTECYGMNSAAWRDTLLRMNIKEDVA